MKSMVAYGYIDLYKLFFSKYLFRWISYYFFYFLFYLFLLYKINIYNYIDYNEYDQLILIISLYYRF